MVASQKFFLRVDLWRNSKQNFHLEPTFSSRCHLKTRFTPVFVNNFSWKLQTALKRSFLVLQGPSLHQNDENKIPHQFLRSKLGSQAKNTAVSFHLHSTRSTRPFRKNDANSAIFWPRELKFTSNWWEQNSWSVFEVKIRIRDKNSRGPILAPSTRPFRENNGKLAIFGPRKLKFGLKWWEQNSWSVFEV